MPELPEVEITRQKLRPLIRGRRILDFWTDWPNGLRSAYSQAQIVKSVQVRKILDVTRHGKVLFLKLSGRPASRGRASLSAGKPEFAFAIHLRMSGRLAVVASNAPRGKWDHYVWRLPGNRELRFIDPRKFGVVWYGSEEDFRRDPYLGNLGRDARGLTFQGFREALRGRKGMVKFLLLRQDVFAGIGNIIADESLWRARIHPRALLADLPASKLRVLHRAIRATLQAMLASGGTSLRNWGHPDGKRGGYQERRFIYGKAGKFCPRCKTKLSRIVVGGRGTTVCARCQRP